MPGLSQKAIAMTLPADTIALKISLEVVNVHAFTALLLILVPE